MEGNGTGSSLGLRSSRVRTGFISELSSTGADAGRVPLKRTNSYVKSNITSTWNVGTSASEEYVSEKHSHYTNPRQKLANSQLQEQVMKFPYEQQREKLREKAIEKFEKLAKKKYGSVEGLFAAVRFPILPPFPPIASNEIVVPKGPLLIANLG